VKASNQFLDCVYLTQWICLAVPTFKRLFWYWKKKTTRSF